MSEFSKEEMDEACATLRTLGVASRYDDAQAPLALLDHIGRALLAVDIDDAPVVLRRAAALYTAWRELPKKSDPIEVPTVFDQPTDAQLEKVIALLQELV